MVVVRSTMSTASGSTTSATASSGWNRSVRWRCWLGEAVCHLLVHIGHIHVRHSGGMGPHHEVVNIGGGKVLCVGIGIGSIWWIGMSW